MKKRENSKLLSKMAEYGLTQVDISKIINKSRPVVKKKLDDYTFTQNELRLIYNYLRVLDTDLTPDIFF